MLDSPLLTAEARKYAYKSPGKEIDITLNRGDDISKVRSQPENQGDPVAWTRARSRLALFQSLLALI